MKRLIISMVAAAAMVSGHSALAQSADELTWPNMSSYRVQAGDLIDPASVGRVVTGLSKKQVRLLLNNPHTSEGIVGVHEWNYLFGFLTGTGSERVTCQYKVRFDKEMQVSRTYWKDASCAKYSLGGHLVGGNPVQNQTHPVSLSTDGLFTFGRSGVDDLLTPGRARLNELAVQIKTGFSKVHQVTIVGHTDRIGSVADNARLSQARADTVKQFFIEQGVPASTINTSGKGSAEPVVVCDGVQSPRVVACLAPNRRISVFVNGDK